MIAQNALPGLADIIITRLQQWRSGRTPLPVTLSYPLTAAISVQDEIGWQDFLFGLVNTDLVQLQNQHLQASGLQKTGATWFSNLVRLLWDLQKKLWDHRNSILHASARTVHESELQAINAAVRWELLVGRNGLSSEYNRFFSVEIDRLIRTDALAKQQWLSTVWFARDRLRFEQGLTPWEKDPTAASFLKRARARRKRNREMTFNATG